MIFSNTLLLLTSLLAASSVQGSLSTDVKACLKNTASPPKVLISGDSGYSAASKTHNEAQIYKPVAIIYATNTVHVQVAVKCAKANNVHISPRSGGHSFEEYSTGGQNGYLVVDLGGLQTFSVDKPNMIATIGSGWRLGPIYYKLATEANVLLPAGDCPSVGIGGHSLGGGFGVFSRQFGLVSDNIRELQIVNAKGDVIIASETSNPDLFWAMRGAGANNFGIVTRFKFKVHPVPAVTSSFEYRWPVSNTAQVIDAWEKWGLTASKLVGVELYMDKEVVALRGVYQGPKADIEPIVLKKFFDLVPPTYKSPKSGSFLDAVIRFSDLEDQNPKALLLKGEQIPNERFKIHAVFVKNKGLGSQGIMEIANHLKTATDDNIFVELSLYGGQGSAVNSVPVDASAFSHRSNLYVIDFYAAWDAGASSSKIASQKAWVKSIWEAVKPHAAPNESYQNYIDKDQPTADYYGGNYAKLIDVKNQYDPNNVFQYKQSIPLS